MKSQEFSTLIVQFKQILESNIMICYRYYIINYFIYVFVELISMLIIW